MDIDSGKLSWLIAAPAHGSHLWIHSHPQRSTLLHVVEDFLLCCGGWWLEVWAEFPLAKNTNSREQWQPVKRYWCAHLHNTSWALFTFTIFGLAELIKVIFSSGLVCRFWAAGNVNYKEEEIFCLYLSRIISVLTCVFSFLPLVFIPFLCCGQHRQTSWFRQLWIGLYVGCCPSAFIQDFSICFSSHRFLKCTSSS